MLDLSFSGLLRLLKLLVVVAVDLSAQLDVLLLSFDIAVKSSPPTFLELFFLDCTPLLVLLHVRATSCWFEGA
jgi:hypothetical protein